MNVGTGIVAAGALLAAAYLWVHRSNDGRIRRARRRRLNRYRGRLLWWL